MRSLNECLWNERKTGLEPATYSLGSAIGGLTGELKEI
jgi:hypothetical protein